MVILLAKLLMKGKQIFEREISLFLQAFNYLSFIFRS